MNDESYRLTDSAAARRTTARPLSDYFLKSQEANESAYRETQPQNAGFFRQV